MYKKILFFFIVALGVSLSAQAFAAGLSVTLAPGWNVVSTPRVLSGHSFSVSDNATNFDIYVLNASSTAGWSTMAEMGQSEFQPLYGYFVNNKTGALQTLTLTYKDSVSPSERLFERVFSKTGWYSIGIANPTYAKSQNADTADTDNVSNVLYSITGNHSEVLDFTNSDFPTDPFSVRVGENWKAAVPGSLSMLNDLRETKGYAVYITKDGASYGGFQNTDSQIVPPTTSFSTFSFGKDFSSPSSALTPGSNSVVLAKFFAKPTGEDMELRGVVLNITSSTPLLTGNLVIRVNGASVWSGSVSSNQSVIALSTFPTLTAGANGYITIEGNISSGVPSGASVQVSLDIIQVKRLITNDIIDPMVNTASGNALFVQVAALKVTNMATPVSQNVVAGTTNVVLANLELNAGAVSSGEDIRVSRIIVTDITNGTLTDIGNLVMNDANGNALATTASTAVNSASTSFNFVTPIVVSKNGSVTLSLRGDILSGTSGSHRFAVTLSTDVTAIGVSTGNSVMVTMGFGGGQNISITSGGTLTMSVVTGGTAAPANDQTVIVGATAVPVFAFKLIAQNEPIKIVSLKLTASGLLNTVNDLVNLKLYRDNDTQPFAVAGQMSSSSVYSNVSAVYTWTSTDNLLPAAVQPGSPVTIYVKADIGVAGTVALGDYFSFKIATSSDVGAKGASSGITLDPAAISGAPSVVARSYITPFSVSVSGDFPTGNQVSAIVAGTHIGRMKIYNNGSTKVSVSSIKFTDGGSHTGSSTTYKLYYSDQNSVNYTANIASSSNNSVNFSSVTSSLTIDGGAYRYVTVVINTLGTAVTGDTWQLGIAALGDVQYTVLETDLGYDSNNNGILSGSTTPLYADGKPMLATLTKQ